MACHVEQLLLTLPGALGGGGLSAEKGKARNPSQIGIVLASLQDVSGKTATSKKENHLPCVCIRLPHIGKFLCTKILV